MRKSFLLRDLEVERESFCELTMAKMTHWKLEMTAWHDQSSMMAGVASDSAPTSRVVLAAAMVVGLLPPSGGLAQESLLRRRDGVCSLSNGG
jgi:hypothetical protein